MLPSNVSSIELMHPTLVFRPLRAKGLHVRRRQLEEVVEGQDLLLPARRLADDGLKAWQQVIESRYEGLVAKDATSAYQAGRTLTWLKVKVPNYREGERGWEVNPRNRGHVPRVRP